MTEQIKHNYHELELKGVRHGQGKPIIALHGWLDNVESFATIAPLLAEKGYQVDCWDLIGHGHSDHLPYSSHYHFLDCVPCYIDLIKNVYPAQECILLGHSLGAAMGSYITTFYPEQISHFIAIEALGPITDPSETCVNQIKHYLRFSSQEKHRKYYDSIDAAAQMRVRKTDLSFEHARIICERSLIKKEQGYQWRHDRRLTAPTPLKLTEQQNELILSELTTPTCFIQAEDGFLCDLLKKRYELIPAQKQCHTLEGGHHIHMERPEEVVKIILDFLK